MKFKLMPYFKPYKKLVIFGPIFKFLEAVTDIITPFLVALVLDKGIPNKDINYIILLSLCVFFMNLFGFVFAVICQKCASLTAFGVGRDIRQNIYKKITTLSSSEMDKYTTMSMTNRSVHDVSQLQNAIGMTIRQVSRAPFLLVGSTIMAMIINIKLSLVFLVVIPLILVVFFFVMKKTNPLFSEAKIDLDNLSNVTRENLSGNRVVRAFNKQEYEKARFDNVNKKYTKVNIRVGSYSSALQPLLSLIINLAIIFIVYFGGISVNIGTLSQGQIISFISYLSQISTSLVIIAKLIIVYVRTGASEKRIAESFA